MTNFKWETPKPLRATADSLLSFPVDALPPVLADMVNAVAVSTCTDPGMAGTAILSAVGYCFTGMYRLAGKPDHTEPPVLYSLIIAQPSERKSPVMHMVKAPFDSYERQYNYDHREEIYKAQADKKALIARAAAIEKSKEPDTTEIARLLVEADNIKGDTPLRIAVDDVTPEALVYALADNGTIMMISDEAGMLNNFNGKYSNVPNVDMFLKAWNGEAYIYDRATKGRIEITRPYMSVTLAGQPYIWDNLVSDTVFRSSGFLARFIMCFAKSDIGKRKFDTEPIPFLVKDRYHNFVHQLLTGKHNYKGEEMILKLCDRANEIYVDFCNNYIEKELKKTMLCCQDWGGKFHGEILRIACILHCVKCCSRGVEPSSEEVSVDTIVRANNLALYYQEQAVYGFGMNSPDTQLIKAEKLVQIFKSKNIREGYKSDIHHACRCSTFKDVKEFNSALDLLVEYGYIAVEDVRTSKNKPVQFIYVNPYI